MLKIEQLACRFDQQTVIEDASLHLEKGEIGAILGESGCGKSTMLNVIAGFIRPTHGSVSLQQRVLSTASEVVAPELRKIGFVFQDYALFPHLNVTQNIGFGLRGLNKQEKQKRLDRLTELTGLRGLEKRYPHELSGGQQQRVALVRALAPEPVLLLLDEPFSNLDTELRNKIALELRQLLKELGTTTLLVTHDQNEAYSMCDKIGVMHQQRIAQWGEPSELYNTPATAHIAQFIGNGQLVSAKLCDQRSLDSELGHIPLSDAQFDQVKALTKVDIDRKVRVLARPDEFYFDDTGAEVRIFSKAFAGKNTRYQFETENGARYEGSIVADKQYEVGETATIGFNPTRLVTFAAD